MEQGNAASMIESQPRPYDAAVVGLGTVGVFACLELLRRGQKVIGFDQFAPPHGRGSHSGSTRVFRTAYAEHPAYVPLALRAGSLWDQFGAAHGSAFLHRTGMVSLGPAESPLLAGARMSAASHGLPLENLSREQILSRFPVFQLPADWEGILEPGAGWIDVDAALRAGLDEAARAGADLQLNTCIRDWAWTGAGFVLHTPGGTVHASRLVVTAGAWASRMMADLALPLKVLRKVLVWVDPLRDQPVPVFAASNHFFYGFPNTHGHGVKLALHWSEAPVVTPDASQPEATPEEVRPVLEAAAELLPAITGPLPHALQRVSRTATCFYTMTPDEHFIVDRHPQIPNLVFAAGLSGHGFKFAPAIGEALADLALAGETALPIDFLGLRRFSSV